MESPNRLPGKSITTSVPSIAIRFHSGDEELEMYQSGDEEEEGDKEEGGGSGGASSSSVTPTIPSRDPSPMKEYFKGIGKRSTSVDGGISEVASSSSDTWRMFHELKGKITKTVEEKLTEMKTDRKSSNTSTPILSGRRLRAGGNDSSISDSEDISEKSSTGKTVAKTSFATQTAEKAVHFNTTEDDVPSTSLEATESKSVLRKRKKSQSRNRKGRTGSTSSDSADVESGMEMLEETKLPGEDYRGVSTVDFRHDPPIVHTVPTKRHSVSHSPENILVRGVKLLWAYRYLVALTLATVLYSMYPISPYITGMIGGVVATMLYHVIIGLASFLEPDDSSIPNVPFKVPDFAKKPILAVPSTNDTQLTVTQCAGWMNELPTLDYDPDTYHINNTQTVYVRLNGSTLTLSHPKTKIQKRASWNERKYKLKFVHQRIYDIAGCELKLLPEGITRKRTWSKKYPICIVLTHNAMKNSSDLELNPAEEDIEPAGDPGGQYSRIDEEFVGEMENEAAENILKDVPSDLSMPGVTDEGDEGDGSVVEETPSDKKLTPGEASDDDTFCLIDRTDTVQTRLYMFARADRQKEDWYRRFAAAVRYAKPVGVGVERSPSNASIPEFSYGSKQTGAFVAPAAKTMAPDDYLDFMAKFHLQVTRDRLTAKIADKLKLEREVDCDVMWINAMVGHVLYDILKSEEWTEKIRRFLQKKMENFKLPYFMDSMVLSEMDLGMDVPLVHRASQAVLDEHGLWVDLDITYEGNICLTIETKLNLMKLKTTTVERAMQQAHQSEAAGGAAVDKSKSPIFDSELEDSAETDETTEEELSSTSAEETGGKSAETSPSKKAAPASKGKGVMRMMNKIVASKYFQQATENKFIKRAMVGVSNTVITVAVEFRGLSGSLALNFPPPPSERLWYGFRGNPKVWVKARPKFGERQLNIKHVASWIEKRLLLEFQRKFVLPNMDDLVIPHMSTKAPR